MKHGILIYTKEDYDKNTWFADQIIANGSQLGLDIKVVLTHQFRLKIEGCDFTAHHPTVDVANVSFAINRSRNYYISNHLQQMGMRLLNNAQVTHIANNKALSHQYVNSLAPSVCTYIVSKQDIDHSQFTQYPYIVKSIGGHGGSEVFKVTDPANLAQAISRVDGDAVLIQKIAPTTGVDIRVYILGGEIYHAVKRVSDSDFRANFSQGGSCELYQLNPQERAQVQKITATLQLDFAGIDFLLDADGNLLFNEIEDAVGCRMLHQLGIDFITDYTRYLAATTQSSHNRGN